MLLRQLAAEGLVVETGGRWRLSMKAEQRFGRSLRQLASRSPREDAA
jgi:hypothetical protein